MQNVSKKIAIRIVVGIIVFIGGLVLAIYIYNYNLNNISIKKDGNTFGYTFEKRFIGGNRWKLAINKKYAYSFVPFEGLTKEEMKKHLTNIELIKVLVDNGNVDVFALPLEEYESKYIIIYTINGEKYSNWEEDVSYIEEYSEGEYLKEIKQNLEILYKYISENQLKKISEETWE